MIAELHCHTSEYSACSHVNAVELVTKAYKVGLDAIVITDHHYQWKDQELEDVKKSSGLPDIFHILAGQEFKTSDYGDILIYGVKETIHKQSLTLEQVRKKYPNAAIIWAHPYRHDHTPAKEKLLNPLHDGIEIFSSNYNVTEAARALKDWHEMKFTAIAGTDTHALSYTGSYPTHFDHPFTTIEEFAAEIKAGRCRPFFREIEKAGTTDTKVTDISIGTKPVRQKMIIKTYTDPDAWKQGERSYHIAGEIAKNGFDSGIYRVSKPLDKDEKNLSLIEEHVGNESLHDKLVNGSPEEAKNYLRMAAGWLAELHNLELKITPPEEYLQIEKERLVYYLSVMYEENHPHTLRAQQVLDEVWRRENELINSNPDILVQGHGDFHLKNIFIGKDRETNEEYIAAIDFNSSFLLPRAFDVGTFISQYKNMFFDSPETTHNAPIDIFLHEYIKLTGRRDSNFNSQVQLYKARTNLSIIYYLVKVGKGESENFWTVLVDAERSLAHVSFGQKYST